MRQLKITKQVTNRETASLDKYLQEIGKVDLITAEEEVELAQRIKAGDEIALEKNVIFKSNKFISTKKDIVAVISTNTSLRASERWIVTQAFCSTDSIKLRLYGWEIPPSHYGHSQLHPLGNS